MLVVERLSSSSCSRQHRVLSPSSRLRVPMQVDNATMALLFTYIDDNYVMQIADERISVWNPARRCWTVRDDETAMDAPCRLVIAGC